MHFVSCHHCRHQHIFKTEKLSVETAFKPHDHTCRRWSGQGRPWLQTKRLEKNDLILSLKSKVQSFLRKILHLTNTDHTKCETDFRRMTVCRSFYLISLAALSTQHHEQILALRRVLHNCLHLIRVTYLFCQNKAGLQDQVALIQHFIWSAIL